MRYIIYILKKLCKKSIKYANKYEFVNLSIGSDNLLLVLCGFQPFYWNVIFDRIINQRSFNELIDICICVLGENGDVLKKIAENNRGAYLRIDKDLLAQVQNNAIMLHPDAKWIFNTINLYYPRHSRE